MISRTVSCRGCPRHQRRSLVTLALGSTILPRTESATPASFACDRLASCDPFAQRAAVVRELGLSSKAMWGVANAMSDVASSGYFCGYSG